MTTLELEIALIKHFDYRRNLIVPNVTDMSNCPIYFEADILKLSNLGYATGIELKISKADLKNDFKKRHIKTLTLPNYKSYLNVYYKGLKHFYYAVPEELKEEALKQIPEYFGLYICEENTHSYLKFKIKEVRKPKMLYNYKWTDKERYELARLGAMRIVNMKQKILKLNDYVKNINSFEVIAKVEYILTTDDGIITVNCLSNESDKTIISRAQKIFKSRTNITYYGEQTWKVKSRELIKTF